MHRLHSLQLPARAQARWQQTASAPRLSRPVRVSRPQRSLSIQPALTTAFHHNTHSSHSHLCHLEDPGTPCHLPRSPARLPTTPLSPAPPQRRAPPPASPRRHPPLSSTSLQLPLACPLPPPPRHRAASKWILISACITCASVVWAICCITLRWLVDSGSRIQLQRCQRSDRLNLCIVSRGTGTPRIVHPHDSPMYEEFHYHHVCMSATHDLCTIRCVFIRWWRQEV